MYIIQQSNNADSRTATSKNKEDLMIDTMKHIKDVQSVMSIIATKLIENSIKHDYTKLTKFEDFYKDWACNDGSFMKKEWYKYHVQNERHHSTAYEFEDYNLLDVIEEVVDKVCAGKGRSGKVNLEYFNFSDELLQRALKNTITLVDEVTGGDENVSNL